LKLIVSEKDNYEFIYLFEKEDGGLPPAYTHTHH